MWTHYIVTMDITATLRKAAEQRQLSVYQIAKETGLNQSGLNQFFNGTKDDLRLSTVQVLCDYLGWQIRLNRSRALDPPAAPERRPLGDRRSRKD